MKKRVAAKKPAEKKPKKTKLAQAPEGPAIHPTEIVEIASLKAHPKNYRKHPEPQVAEIAESIKQHGIYKNIVVAKDGTILAGHGLVLGAQKLGMTQLPVVRIPLAPDHPRALKIVAADNELPRLAEDDPKGLAEMLEKIQDEDEVGLLGTGYDDAALLELLPKEPEPPGEFTSFDLNIETEHQCPKCGYEWSGKASRSGVSAGQKSHRIASP